MRVTGLQTAACTCANRGCRRVCSPCLTQLPRPSRARGLCHDLESNRGGTVAGEKSRVAGMLLVFKGVCSVPEVLLSQRLRATGLVLSL